MPDHRDPRIDNACRGRRSGRGPACAAVRDRRLAAEAILLAAALSPGLLAAVLAALPGTKPRR